MFKAEVDTSGWENAMQGGSLEKAVLTTALGGQGESLEEGQHEHG